MTLRDFEAFVAYIEQEFGFSIPSALLPMDHPWWQIARNEFWQAGTAPLQDLLFRDVMKHVARIASHQHGLLGFFGHGFHLPITDNECPDYRGINGWPAMRGRLRENFAAGGNALIQCRHGMGHSRIPSAKPRLFTTNNAIGNTNAGNASHAAAEDEEALRHSQALVRRARWIVLGLVILAVVYWAGSCIVDPTCK